MRLGPRGLNLIRSRETLRLTAYLPTPHDVLTIGYGHTRGVSRGMTCTVEQAEAWLREDAAGATRAVQAIAAPLTQAMFDALVSLVFNEGAGAVVPESTIGKALAARDYFAAWAAFTLWRKQAAHDLLGLARRRSAEMVLFLEDGLPSP